MKMKKITKRPDSLKPDTLLITNKASLERFEQRLKPHGLLIMNTSLIKNLPERSDIKTIGIKATDIAKELGNSQAANMVMLGALIAETGIINLSTVSTVLKEIAPAHKKRLIPLNEKAYKKGLEEIAV